MARCPKCGKKLKMSGPYHYSPGVFKGFIGCDSCCNAVPWSIMSKVLDAMRRAGQKALDETELEHVARIEKVVKIDALADR